MKALAVAAAFLAVGATQAAPTVPPPARFALVTTHRDSTRFTDSIAREVAQMGSQAIVNDTARPYVALMQQLHYDFQVAFYQSGIGARHADPVPQCDALDSAGNRLIRSGMKVTVHVPNCPAWQESLVAQCRTYLSWGANRCFLDSMGGLSYLTLIDATTGQPATPTVSLAQWEADLHALSGYVAQTVGRRIWVNCGGDNGWVQGVDQASGCDDPTNVTEVELEGFAGNDAAVPADENLLRTAHVAVLADCKMLTGYDRAWLDRCLTVFDAAGAGDYFNADVPGDPALELDEQLAAGTIR